MLKKIKKLIKNSKKEVIISSFLFLTLSIFFIGSAFAALTPNQSVIITSKNTSYENKIAGSWQVKKSGKWLRKGKARVSFNVDSNVMSKSKNTDTIIVMDVSNSMYGEKLNQAKQSSKKLVENLLSNSDNKVSLISFSKDSTILSYFSNDKNTLINQIDDLEIGNSTNYYQALISVDTVLKDYNKKDNTDLIVLFLTGGYPNVDTPNQIAQYRYLKKIYPFITINAIQYEFGKEILSSTEKISDNQFLANSNTLDNVLMDASVIPVKYDEFQLVDYIDNQYFTLSSEDDITVSKGTVSLEYEQTKQKIVWTIDNLKSGEDVKLTMDIDLNKEYIGEGGVYPTNEKVEIITKIGEQEENVSSTETPVLAESYKVIYEGNAPNGATVSNIPKEANYSVFSTATISTDEPTCEGYEFKGWEINTENVIREGDNHFIMPEKNVVLRAKWSKVEIAKSMDGVVSEQGEPIMMGKSWWNTDYEKEKVASIEVKTSTEIPDTAIAYWDASQAQDKSVVAYIEDTGNGDYKVSIGGLGGVIANSNCSSLFYGFTNAKTIMLDNFDTSSVTDMSNIFKDCNSLVDLKISDFNTSKVTTMAGMFYGCSSLTDLNLNHFNTSNVTIMLQMFYNCANLINLNVNNFDTSNVTNMAYMFNICKNLTNLNLSSFDTSNVTNMYDMFRDCTKLISLNLSNFDTSNVNNMEYMFSSCRSLVDLDITNFDTSKVTAMSYMFSGCSGLTNLDLNRFNTLNVTSMTSMFSGCSSLTDLDLGNFDTSKVTNMSNMFSGCSSLTDLDIHNFNTTKVTNMSSMFNGCSGLLSLDVSSFNTSKVTSMVGMFQNCRSLTTLDVSNFDNSNVSDMTNMFRFCNNLIDLNLSDFDTLNVVKMSYMFNGCSSLETLNLNNFNTKNVTDMSGMFGDCIRLVSLDVTNFDTSKVTSMSGMFSNCSSLMSLDITSFDTSNVTNMSSMFKGCSGLTVLDVSHLKTSNVTNMSYMFNNCSNLKNINVTNFNTSKVTNMNNMFSSCRNLVSLEVSNFDTSNVTDMNAMFSSCVSLVNLDVSHFNTSNVTDMSGMFAVCNSLERLDVSGFDTAQVTSMSAMFRECTSLSYLDIGNFDTSKVTNMWYMFFYCSDLISVDMRNAEFNATTYNAMFFAVSNNINVIVKDSVAESWVRARLDEANRPNASITIIKTEDVDVDIESSHITDSAINTNDDFGSDINFNVISRFTPLPLRYGVHFDMIRWL